MKRRSFLRSAIAATAGLLGLSVDKPEQPLCPSEHFINGRQLTLQESRDMGIWNGTLFPATRTAKEIHGVLTGDWEENMRPPYVRITLGGKDYAALSYDDAYRDNV